MMLHPIGGPALWLRRWIDWQMLAGRGKRNVAIQ
jgi:hypothetical protein